MKLVDRVKSIDWKEFGINHGEKIGLGVVGLLVVLILFSGTRWKTFQEKQPEELTSEVAKQTQLLEAATWPVSEQEIYTDKYDVNSVYKNTISVVKVDEFRYPTNHPMVWSLHRRQEKIKEPSWLPVKELIATSDRFILELPPEGQEAMTDGALALGEEPGAAETPDSREAAILGTFQQPTQTGGTDGPMGAGFPGKGGVGGVDGLGCPGDEDDSGGGRFAVDDGMGDGMGDGLDAYGMDGAGTAMNIRGVRYIAVRGVYPLREQFEKIMQARSDPTLQNPYSVIDIRNFEIQRRSPGDKDWTTLDKSVAYDLLAEAANYADDVVDYSNTHWVITSPLPMRLVRTWSPYFVGHPKIKTLTEKEREYRRLLNEEMVRLEKESKQVDDDQVGGFAVTQRNLQSLSQDIGQDDSMMRRLTSNIKQSMSTDGDDEGGFTMPAELQNMLATNQFPDYLLFRYLDFDVEPGQTYEYRVQLKLSNPNRNQLTENLISEDVGKGDYRYTPWSEPSKLTKMAVDSEYFVRDITPPKSGEEPAARIDVFHWLSEVGTTANKVVEVRVGQLIGQTAPPVDEDKPDQRFSDDQMVEVLRPYESFKLEPMDMVGQDALVDFDAPAKTRGFHSDLGVRELEPVSAVLVVNQYGKLEERNPFNQREDYQRAERLRYAEHNPWEYLKKIGDEGLGPDGMDTDMTDGMGDTDDLIYRSSPGGKSGSAGRGGGRGGSPQAGGGSQKGGGRSGGANPLRRNRRGRGAVDS